MAEEDTLAHLRSDLGALLDRTDVKSRREFGRSLGWSTGEEMIRMFLAGNTDIALKKAADWADRCGAELRAVPRDDPWAALLVAIDALPPDRPNLRRHLRAIVESEDSRAPVPVPTRLPA